MLGIKSHWDATVTVQRTFTSVETPCSPNIKITWSNPRPDITVFPIRLVSALREAHIIFLKPVWRTRCHIIAGIFPMAAPLDPRHLALTSFKRGHLGLWLFIAPITLFVEQTPCTNTPVDNKFRFKTFSNKTEETLRRFPNYNQGSSYSAALPSRYCLSVLQSMSVVCLETSKYI